MGTQQLTAMMTCRIKWLTPIKFLVRVILRLPIEADRQIRAINFLLPFMKAQYKLDNGEWKDFEHGIYAVADNA